MPTAILAYLRMKHKDPYKGYILCGIVSQFRFPLLLPLTFDPLLEQFVPTVFILDRFSVNCGILYCSNDSLISTMTCMGCSFFDMTACHVRPAVFIKFCDHFLRALT